MGAQTTRRSLFAGAALLPVALSLPAMAKPTDLQALWILRARLEKVAHDDPGDHWEAQSEPKWDAFFGCEDDIARAPCRSLGDAIIKLELYAVWAAEQRAPEPLADDMVAGVLAFLRGQS